MTKHPIQIFFLAVVCWALPMPSWAFPGMIRHGYVNCTSCHLAPTGGGVLTAYGRELSQEILSTASGEHEGKLIYGLFKDTIPEKLLFGGDTRLMGTYKDNPRYREKRLFLMQSDLEASYELGTWVFDLELGFVDGEVDSRHFVMFRLDQDSNLRLGKFFPAFGVNIPEHTVVTRRNLGWDEGSDTYNLEYSRLRDDYSVYGTAVLGKFERVETKSNGLTIGTQGVAERGVAFRGSVYPTDHFEVGGGYFYGKNDSGGRHVLGSHAVLGLTSRLYWLAELDFQYQSQWGAFDYQRLDWEFIQGLHAYLTQEWARPDFGDSSTRIARYGVGFQAFPRPHWELDFKWSYEQNPIDQTHWSQMGWAMLHFYL
ncbi:hypothetical protein WDW37_12730 [Bdellovibrionota bacterium FG-1]